MKSRICYLAPSCSSGSTNWCSICGSRAFLKHSAEVVYHLDGKNVSVVLQGKSWPLRWRLLESSVWLPLICRLHCLAFLVPVSEHCFPIDKAQLRKYWAVYYIFWCLWFLCFYRRRRQRPELCHFLLGATDVGPSLPQPHWVSGSGAEGMGDGRPSLLGQMQPFKEERQRGGGYQLFSNLAPTWTHLASLLLLSMSSLFALHWSRPHCSCCSWTAYGRWCISTQQLSSSQRLIWLYWATACGSRSSVLSSLILPNSELSTYWWELYTYFLCTLI